MQIRIMLVEDRVEFRLLLADLLGRQRELEVVAQAGSLAEARRLATAVKFEVAILDMGLPDGNGAGLIAELREANPGVAVLILSASLDPSNLERATEAGVDQILDKFASPTEVVAAVRRLESN
jgi:two-component system response regulator DesR